MKDEILMELSNRWIEDAKTPEVEDGSPEARERNEYHRGYRECKRECADTIRSLLSIFGQSK